MESKIYQNIDDIDSNLWDSLIPLNEIVKTHRFLRAVEHSNLKGCRYWYILFFERGNAVANAALFSMDFYLDVIAPSFVKAICSNVRKVAPSFLRVKLMGCGTPVATCANGIGVSERVHLEKVISSLTQTIFQIAKQEKAHCILYKEYTEQENKAFDILQSDGFIKLPSLPTSFVDISWSSFDEYLKSLKKKYRLLAKNELAKLNTSRISITTCENFECYADELWTLYMNVYKKAEVKFEQLTPDFFRNIALNLKGESRVILIKLDGKIVGFELIVEDEVTLRPLYLGIDYVANKNYSIYFNSIYQIIKHGIERKKKVIELGQTSYYPKLKVGARVEPLYLSLKFKSPVAQYLLKYPLRAIFPERNYMPKNVFKNQTSIYHGGTDS